MGETTKHQKHRQQNHFPTKQVRVVSAWLRHAAGSVNGDNELFSLDLTSPLFTPRFFNLLKITPILSLPPEIDVLQSFLPRCFQQGPGASRAAPGGTVQGGYLWSSSALPYSFVWQLQGCLLPLVPLGLKLLAVFILWLHLPVAVGAAWLLDLPGSASLHLPAAWIR